MLLQGEAAARGPDPKARGRGQPSRYRCSAWSCWPSLETGQDGSWRILTRQAGRGAIARSAEPGPHLRNLAGSSSGAFCAAIAVAPTGRATGCSALTVVMSTIALCAISSRRENRTAAGWLSATACGGRLKVIATLKPLTAPGLLVAQLAMVHLDWIGAEDSEQAMP